MRKSFLITLGIAMSFQVMAQESEKQKEIGIVFYNLNNFGLTYKIGSQNSLWRFNTVILTGNNQEYKADSIETSLDNMGFGFALGKEFRKEIYDNLEFRYGADLSFSYKHSKSEYNDKTVDNRDRIFKESIYRPGFNLMLGFNYVINGKFVLGAEIQPAFTYITGTVSETQYFLNDGEEITSDISGFNYGLSNTSALLSISYRLN